MKDLYNEIANRMIEQLEQGLIPWRKPERSFGHRQVASRELASAAAEVESLRLHQKKPRRKTRFFQLYSPSASDIATQ